MRIGLDYRTALVNREGIGRAVRELVRALPGVDPELALELFGSTLREPRVSAAELGLAPERSRLVRLRIPSRAWPLVLGATGRGVDDVLGGVDLVHHPQLRALRVRAAVETATIWDVIYTRGGRGFLDPAEARRMEARAHRIVRRVARVQVPSEHVAREVAEQLSVGPERIDVVPLGCDHVLRERPEVARAPARPFLLTVARVDPRKNHRAVLDALADLTRGGLDLEWVAAGPLGYRGEEIRARIESSDQAARVRWLGEVSEAELRGLYERCACFVFPSLDEGFGLPPLEAMACGAPVVAARAGSLPEVLGAGARLWDPDGAEPLADAIAAVLDDPGPWRRAGRERANTFTWERAARTCLASWRRALSL